MSGGWRQKLHRGGGDFLAAAESKGISRAFAFDEDMMEGFRCLVNELELRSYALHANMIHDNSSNTRVYDLSSNYCNYKTKGHQIRASISLIFFYLLFLFFVFIIAALDY